MKNIKQKIRFLIGIIILSLVVFCGYEIFFSMDNVVVKTMIINDQKIPNEFNNFRIGIISDIKYQKNMTKERLKRMIDTLNQQSPDVVLFLGDLYHDGISEYEESSELVKLLTEIKADYGKFLVFGDNDNHEIVQKVLEAANFESLNNKTTNLYYKNKFIQLIGLDNDTAVFEQISPDHYAMVMSHYPDIANNVPEAISLVVAGHTLGNQINIPFFGNNNRNGGYTLGEYTINNHTKLYVNGGLGTVNNDLRFLSPPEITILKIQK